MRYRLRTLLIVLALGPPVLAVALGPLLKYLIADPQLRQAAWFASVSILAYAAFWLACGLTWLATTRAVERLLGERRG
jgi:uncharacterized membrane protein YciS (DUF1049 family)